MAVDGCAGFDGLGWLGGSDEGGDDVFFHGCVIWLGGAANCCPPTMAAKRGALAVGLEFYEIEEKYKK